MIIIIIRYLLAYYLFLVDFLCATRIHTGSVSWFHEVDPDPTK